MKLVQVIFLLTFLLPLGLKAEIFDEIKSHRVGIALSNTSTFTDSSYTSATNGFFKEGTLLTIVEETALEHEDDAQKQLFKWYRVKAKNGTMGWVFGDALLIKEKENLIPKTLKPYLYRKFRFNSGFENSMIWFGSLVGRDNFGAQMMSNSYEEAYLIITNEKARSVFIPIASVSQFGESRIKTFSIQELTGDQVPDFVLQNEVVDEKNQPQQFVQLYTFQAGTLRKVFEEKININSRINQVKQLVFEKEMIRGYYFEQEDNHPQLYSYTYFWNQRNRQYEMLYPPAPFVIRAQPNRYGVNLMNMPDVYAGTKKALNTSTQLIIKKLISKTWVERGRQYSSLFAETALENGTIGYIPFEYLTLLDFKNTDWVKSNLLSKPIDHQLLSCLELPEIAPDTSSIRN